MTLLRALACVLFLALPAQAQEAVLLDPLFGDHLVLQRDEPVRVWGTASPGEEVTVTLADQSARTTTGTDGTWSAELSALPAGGPHTLMAHTDDLVDTAEDVLVGDVFLCAGQSNMELPVSRALNAPTEIRTSADDGVRMLAVGHAASPAPRATFADPVAWEVAAPETVPGWSAACYFFGRDLRRTEGVPIGLITSAWGGSNIRAWLRADALTDLGGYDDALATLALYAEDEAAAQQRFGQAWQAWWQEQHGEASAPWQPEVGAAWADAPAGLGDWTAWDDLAGFTGMVWFRTTVDLTAEQAQQDAVLALGGVDEVDQTWINGQVVGNTFGYGTERTYRIPADMLQEGENVVVVNVLNTYGGGGLIGDPGRRALVVEDGTRLPLTGWQYQPVEAEGGHPPRAPWESVAGLTTIHNAMVAPLRDLGLRAALWYQGESNTGEAEAYLGQLQALVAQWRRQFGDDFPVLIVQLANYGAPPTAPTASGWAEVREAQRLVAQQDTLVGLAVAIDLGDAYDIHPANKQQVGRRLARAARHVVYEEGATPSGPVPTHAEHRGDTVVVSFEDVDGELVVYGDARPVGFELCGAEPGTCRYAEARVEGNAVVLDAEGDIERVRYAWSDSPIVNLYDVSGLPVGPFEVEVE